jgi:hypothetical protein
MFSIVMPVWNKRAYLEATIASVLAQEWREFELIAVDDGSTDGSLEILRGFDDPRLRLVTQSNAGPGAARNVGIEAARHEWIAFLDADDLWLPCHLAELDRIRTLHPGSGLIGTSYFMVRDGRRRTPGAERAGRIGAIDYLAAFAKCENNFVTSSAAIRRHVYRALGGFGPFADAQDSEYWARIALDWPVAVSNRRTVAYRLGTGGITDRITLQPRERPVRHVRDLSPAAAMLIDRDGAPASAAQTRSIERFLNAEFRHCARKAARIADIETLRGLGKLASGPRGAMDRLLLAVARLPRPVAETMCRLGFPIWAAFRPLRHRRRRRALVRSMRFAPVEGQP